MAVHNGLTRSLFVQTSEFITVIFFGDFNHCRINVFVIDPCETISFIDNGKIDTVLGWILVFLF